MAYGSSLVAAVLLAFASVLPAAPGPARLDPPQGRLGLKVYGPEQGLANPVVWSMVQDHQGFLWAGTEDGLFRYDGARFQGWSLKDGLPSALVEHLCVDPTGIVWIGTYGGLAAWTPRGVRPVTEGIPATRIKGIATLPDRTVWVATVDGPYQCASSGRFAAVPGWPGGAPTALAVAPDRSWAYVAYSEGGRHGVRRWEASGWRELALKPAPADPIGALAAGGNGALWARSLRELWAGAGPDAPLVAVRPQLPPVNQQPCLYLDPRSRLWVPSVQGMTLLENGRREDLTEQTGFSPRVVHSVLQDREGSVWIGGNDLFRILGGGVIRHFGRAQGLPSETVWCILRDPAGRLLVGTDAGLSVASAKGFSLVPGTSGFQVRSAAVGPDGAVYATGHAAILRWDPATGNLRRFGAESDFQPGGRVFRLRFGPDGTLWIATEGAGLLRASGTGGTLRFNRVVVQGGHPRERFTDVWFDPQGRGWAAGSAGLAILEGGSWRRFTTSDGLKHDNTAFVRPLSDGTMLVAYFAAPSLTQFNYRDGRFQVLRHLDQVFPADKVIYFFGEDARRGLWIGTGQGVYLLNPAGRLEHFGRNAGLASENTSNMSFFGEPDGTVWFGTTAGLHRFDAALYEGTPAPPATHLLEARFGGRAIPGEELAPLRIPTREATVEVRFAAPSSVREGSVEHQARLVGFENEWHLAPSREARYPRLPAGRYTFEARARIGHGEYGQPARWNFEVLPAWYQAWWFRLLAGLATLGLAALVVWLRLTALQRRNRALESTVASRTRELQAANDLLRNQSLTDPLTGLRNRRFLGVCMPEEVAQAQRRHHDLRRGSNARMSLNVDLLLLMVDVDHFKSVNDQHGHHAGDLVLQQVAALIRGAVRDTDTVVRWGGEEFLVIGRNTSRSEAHVLAERIRAAVAGHPFDIGTGEPLRRTCSLGFALFPLSIDRADGLSWEVVVDLADRCLYAAKRSGRDGWAGILAGEGLEPESLARRLQNSLRGLIEEGRLKVITSRSDAVLLDWDMQA